jgi:hypothetical protein
MTTHALMTSGAIDRDKLIDRIPVRFASETEAAGFLATAAPGRRTPAIIVAGTVFEADFADTTSAAVAGWIVVSLDGTRYKRAAAVPALVQSTVLATPPALSSAIWGQAWVVPAAATGAWAGQSGRVAVATPVGWSFLLPQVGQIVRSAAAAAFFHYSEAAAWVQGLGAPSPGAVPQTALEMPFGLIIQSRTVTTPPGAAGRHAWLVPAGATGAWAGQTNQVAIGPTGGWSFIAPATGATVWVVDEARGYRWTGSAWSTESAAPLPALRRIEVAGRSGMVAPYAYADGTAPTTSNTVPDMSLTWTPRAAGNVLRLVYATRDMGTGVDTVALFRGADVIANQWQRAARLVEFLVAAADTTAQTWTIRLSAAGAGAAVQVAGRTLSITEFVPT